MLTQLLNQWRILGSLGLPILIGQLAQMANGVVDTLMAGRASAIDLSGVAIGNSLWTPLFLFMIGVLGAAQPLISKARGANQHHEIMPVLWNTLLIGGLASVAIMALLINASPVLELIQLETEASKVAKGYLFAFSFGVPAILLSVALRGLTDGLGFTRIFMSFSILSVLINTPLNYGFIYGKFGLPELGGVGCGWASAISQWICLILFVLYLKQNNKIKTMNNGQKNTLISLKIIKKIINLGVPIGATIFIEATMFTMVALMVAPLGPVAISGHQIALSIASVMFMFPLSMGLALTIRISFLTGTKDQKIAQFVAKSTVMGMAALSLLFATFLFTMGETLASLYTTENEVLALATHLLIFGAIFQIADIIQVVCNGALRGYQDTKVPLMIVLGSAWGIGIPLGYYLAYHDQIVGPMGAAGFWVGLIAGLSSAAILLVLRLNKISARLF